MNEGKSLVPICEFPHDEVEASVQRVVQAQEAAGFEPRDWREGRGYGGLKPTLNEERRYYVYVFSAYPEGEWKPLYVGKGTKLRCIDRFRSLGRGEHPNRLLQHVFSQYVKKGVLVGSQQIGINEGCTDPRLMTEDQAFVLEEKLIRQMGRIDKGTGPLANLAEGGPGSPGRIMSDKEMRRFSQKRLEGLLRRGWKHTDDTRHRLSEIVQEHWNNASPEWRDFHRNRVKEGIAAKRMASK